MLCALTLTSGIFLVPADSFGATVFTTVGNGDAAYVAWDDPSSFGSIYIWKGGTVTSPYTYLSYYIYDYTTRNWSDGWGNIPNSDFAMAGGNHASLNTIANADPDFHIDSGSGGALSIDLQNNGLQSGSYSGTSKQNYNSGSITYKYTGTGSFSSASVSGNCLGYNIATGSAQGEIQRNKTAVITIDKQ